MNALPSGVRQAEALPDTPSTREVVLNLILFQAGWFACVFGAAQGKAWVGIAAAAAIVTLHVARAARPLEEAKLIGIAVLIGALWDSALVSLELLEFTSTPVIAGAAPYWILAMWALFATTLNVSLDWLKGRVLLAALLGAISGPLSYWAGAQLEAVNLVQPALALGALAAGWGVMMPALMALARRYDGVHAVK